MGYPKLTSAEYVKDYILRLSFADGTKADVNFQHELTGGVFESLRDQAYFRSFSVQTQFGTIEWDNGADFAPEFLYELAKASGQQSPGNSRSRKSA